MPNPEMMAEFIETKGERPPKPSPRKPRRLPHASEKQKTLDERWAFIRSCFLVCQLRTDGFYSCQECGDKFDTTSLLELHHITRRSKGGDYTPTNAVLLCRTCHRRADGNELKWDNGRTS